MFFNIKSDFFNAKLVKFIDEIYEEIARHRRDDIVRLRQTAEGNGKLIMKSRKSVYTTFALISQLGISMLVPVFLCIFVGVKLDEKFGTSLTVLFIILGVFAGARNVYVLVRQASAAIEAEKDE